jgi:hypothetical protein
MVDPRQVLHASAMLKKPGAQGLDFENWDATNLNLPPEICAVRTLLARTGVSLRSSGAIPMDTKPLNAVEDGQELATLSSELDQIRDALKLLGLKQCNCCRKYFMCPDGKNLLNVGQLVCFRCLSGWWQQRSPKISIEERNAVEHEILRWLTAYYEGKVIRRPAQMPAAERIQLKIVVRCEHCNGTGQSDGSRCQNCDGRGFDWVVVTRY